MSHLLRSAASVAAILLILSAGADSRAVPSALMQATGALGPPSRAGTVENAVAMLQMICSLEEDYAQRYGEGQFGWFEDMQTAGYISETQTPSDYLYGFELEFYLSENRDWFTIMALPADDPEMIGLLVYPTCEVLALSRYEFEEWDEPWEEVRQHEAEQMASNGSFDYFDMAQMPYGDPTPTYMLNSAFDDFMISAFQTNVTGDRIGGGVYRYSTNTFYAALTYDSAIGATATQYTHYAELVASENRARGTLRSLGSTQLAYQSTSEGRIFATFDEAQDEQYVHESYTLDNMVENYRLLWFLNEDRSSFAIVAVPTAEVDVLGIYMVDSSQVVSQLHPSDTPTFSETWASVIEDEDGAFAQSGALIWTSAMSWVEELDSCDFALYLNSELNSFLLQTPLVYTGYPVGAEQPPHYIYLSETRLLYEEEPVL